MELPLKHRADPIARERWQNSAGLPGICSRPGTSLRLRGLQREHTPAKSWPCAWRLEPLYVIAAQEISAIQGIQGINVLFIEGFGPIVRDTTQSRKLYSEVLGIPFKEENGEYLHTEALDGANTFALWSLSQAAQSCFGRDFWPDNVPVPQAWLDFDVDGVQVATAALESRGYRLLIKNKKEPWGQTVSRFLSPEGLLVGITFTTAMRGKK